MKFFVKFFAPFALAATCAAVDPVLPPPAPRRVDFVKDIQPILREKCYACHGPAKQEAFLRWDSNAALRHKGEHGLVVVPGKSAASRMIQLVAGAVPDLVMPQKGGRLTPEQVGLLRAWIDQGAKWPDSASVKVNDPRDHWAFKAPVRPRVPAVKNKNWPRNPIDNFVLARLEKEKLKPSPEADRVTFIRRASLDLTGLPPTPAEVDAFLADTSRDAFMKLVERLLASPHYGERWARHWLDAARYADTNGFEKDAQRSVWPWRDWVIGAFNRDLPFDRFTVEQLAGDLLPGATLDQRVATGFLRNSMVNQEGGIEPEQFRVEGMIDRMDAVGRTWLGLTVNCCQCHNHKYDPITQREYYGLFAFLNNDDEPFIEVPTAEQQKKRDEILAQVRAVEDELMNSPDVAARFTEWESSLANAAGEWTVLEPREWINFATKYEKQRDGSLLGGGDVKPGAVTHVWVDAPFTNITGFRLEVMTNPNLPYGGPGLVAKGSWLLKEITCEAYAAQNPTVTNKVKFRRAVASLEAPGFAVTNAIDGNTERGGWTASLSPVERNREERAVFECAEPITNFPGGAKLKFSIYQKHSNGDGHSGALDKESKLDCHAFGRFRLSATAQSGPLKADPLSPAERKLLAIPHAQRTPSQQRELFSVFRRADSSCAEANKKISGLLAEWPYATTTLALAQRTNPRATHLFKRGDWQKPGPAVEPGVPGILHPFAPDAPRNRLGFAQWLVDRRNPVTARVIVNRVWQAYFGQGLVTTPEDFGVRADAPSHPELLDWLACEFMDRGWSFKELHRLITGSATYRQNSHVTPELYARDPYNRLLARGPRFRVESETIQDIALAAGGLLSSKVGGPGVRPPLPAGVGDTSYGGFNWPASTGEDRYRRGMYTFWKRALPFPTLTTFDSPSADNSCTRRVRSNTPLQALVTLNEKTFVEAAQALALRTLREGGETDGARATYAFRLCVARQPDAVELKSLLNLLNDELAEFSAGKADAKLVALRDAKESPALPGGKNLTDLAAWTLVSRAILNLDETITKE